MTGSRDSCQAGDDHCITCGDVAVPMRIVRVDGDLAVCAQDGRTTEAVAVDLVAPVSRGDRVLVHAGVAIGRVGEPA